MKIDKEIWRLAAPAVISNITVPLLGLCDTTISGHMGSPRFIGAVAVGAMMANTLFWLFGFLRMGASGLTAQAYGSRNIHLIRKIYTQGVCIGFAAGMLLILLSAPLASLLLMIMHPDAAVALLAHRYFIILLCGAPPMFATMAMMGWMLGMQSSTFPMIVAITTNIINIITSITLVYAMHLGLEGLAWGTALANWLGMLLALWLAVRMAPDGKPFCQLSASLFRGSDFKRFFSVNKDIFLRSACIMAVSASITATGARMGETVLACNAVIMQFFVIFSYFMDGVAFSAEALCGRFAGEKSEVMLKSSIKHIIWWGAIIMVVFALIYRFAYSIFAAFITNDAEVLVMVEKYAQWIYFLPSLSVAAFIFDGIYIGLTATRRMLCATALAAVIFFIATFINYSNHHIAILLPSNARLWTGFLIYLLSRGALLAVMTRRVVKLAIATPLPN